LAGFAGKRPVARREQTPLIDYRAKGFAVAAGSVPGSLLALYQAEPLADGVACNFT
jgi:hypothetical protein